MELENIDKMYMQPNQMYEKLNVLNNSINFLLDEFKKIYVTSKMNPSDQEYQQQYSNTINGLNEIQSKLFVIANDVQMNVDKINKEMIAIDNNIKKEKERNKQLKLKLGMIENKSNAASEMIHDYTKMYDEKYLRNGGLILSTILCIVSINLLTKNLVV